MGETKTIINFLVLIVMFFFLIYLFIGELISYITSTQHPPNIHVEVKHTDSICVQEERYIHLLYKILLAVKVYHLPHFLLLLLQKHWVDKKSNNVFFLYARNLSITWAADTRYWHWPSLKETRYLVLINSPCHISFIP